MASSLKNKLNALKKAQPAARPAQKRGGLRMMREVFPMPEGLLELNSSGLIPVGWTGKRFDLDTTCFLDTETTGLSGGAGTVAFLVGVGYRMGDGFCVDQFFMSDYSDEPEMLVELSRLLERFSSVVTFNGNRFDLPLISTRCLMNRLPDCVKPMQPLDLLLASRRLWKIRLGSCRLANLEERVLGIPREGDLPGSEVPQRYFDFIKTGNMSLIDDILRHNKQDIVTLGRLLAVLTEKYGEPEKLTDRMDLFSAGKALEKQGDLAKAGKVYRLAALPRPVTTVSDLIGERYAGEAGLRLYRIYRRSKEHDKAMQTLLNMVDRRQGGHVPFVELAKLEEHVYRNYESAMNWALRAREKIPRSEEEALLHRLSRLRAKIEANQRSGGNKNGNV